MGRLALATILFYVCTLVYRSRKKSELAALTNPAAQLRFSGAVGGALPTVNVGRRDLAAADIRRVEAVLNGTTQLILTLMAAGESFEGALEEAQRIGIAEPDPSLDVDGWDTANKLIIIANAVAVDHRKAE